MGGLYNSSGTQEGGWVPPPGGGTPLRGGRPIVQVAEVSPPSTSKGVRGGTQGGRGVSPGVKFYTLLYIPPPSRFHVGATFFLTFHSEKTFSEKHVWRNSRLFLFRRVHDFMISCVLLSRAMGDVRLQLQNKKVVGDKHVCRD